MMAAHKCDDDGEFKQVARFVKTSAELETMARNSSTVKRSQPGLRPPRLFLAPRDRTVMG